MQTTKPNPWTQPLSSFRTKPAAAPETKARAALHHELHAERTAADVWGVSPEAMQIAIVLALNPIETQSVVSMLGVDRALAICTYGRAMGLDPVMLAGVAVPK